MSMTIYDENQHPRGQADNAGQFRTKPNSGPEATLALDDETTRLTTLACEEAGYGGVMPGVYGVIMDRCVDSDRVFGPPSPDEVNVAYDDRVGPAIDTLSNDLPQPLGGKILGRDGVLAHVAAVCEEAGLGGVMPGIYEVAIDRTSDFGGLSSLTATDVELHYEYFIGPAIDALDNDIQLNHCARCGANTADSKDGNGLCGNCTDRLTLAVAN